MAIDLKKTTVSTGGEFHGTRAEVPDYLREAIAQSDEKGNEAAQRRRRRRTFGSYTFNATLLSERHMAAIIEVFERALEKNEAIQLTPEEESKLVESIEERLRELDLTEQAVELEANPKRIPRRRGERKRDNGLLAACVPRVGRNRKHWPSVTGGGPPPERKGRSGPRVSCVPLAASWLAGS